MNKLKHILTETRFMPLVMSIIITLSIGIVYFNLSNNNKQANHIVTQLHTENVAKIHSDNQHIFKYRSQIQSLQDDHTSYLLQDVFKRLQTRSHLKPSQFHYEKNAKYIKMTAAQSRLNNYDENQIHVLTKDADHRIAVKKHEHPHLPFTNATSPKNAQVFTTMEQESASIAILLIIDLAFITYTVKFNDIKIKHWRKSLAVAQHKAYEHRHHSYIKEYGDDDGFKDEEAERKYESYLKKVHQSHEHKSKD